MTKEDRVAVYTETLCDEPPQDSQVDGVSCEDRDLDSKVHTTDKNMLGVPSLAAVSLTWLHGRGPEMRTWKQGWPSHYRRCMRFKFPRHHSDQTCKYRERSGTPLVKSFLHPLP